VVPAVAAIQPIIPAAHFASGDSFHPRAGVAKKSVVLTAPDKQVASATRQRLRPQSVEIRATVAVKDVVATPAFQPVIAADDGSSGARGHLAVCISIEMIASLRPLKLVVTSPPALVEAGIADERVGASAAHLEPGTGLDAQEEFGADCCEGVRHS
jgi:hypothetical protein